ncbi:MAG TPA: MFS transporter [Gaiellaceae bacterium]|nr:MFS transporter [Gaiellaceae bacterium]
MKILAPFRHRDFTLYWIARSTSWVGDGVMVVALPWQVYELTNSPTAMGIVGAAQMVPIFAFTLVGGVASDRLDRRTVILVSEIVRGVAAGAVGILAVTDRLELWHIGVMVVVFGLGQAFAGPAFGSIVPQIVPEDLLVQANSALFTVNTIALRLGGPSLGGLLIAAFGTGVAFLVDASSFLLGAVAIALLAKRASFRAIAADKPRSVLADIREGFAYVRGRTWLWGTLAWWFFVAPFGHAPYVVLLPYLMKTDLGGGASDLGLLFAAGGVGGVVMSLVLSQVRIPRKHVTFVYAMFAFGLTDLFFYSLTNAPWQTMVIAFFAEGTLTGGVLVWNTLLQRAVPNEFLGRVRSLDSFAAFALTPVAMAVVGPAAELVGVRPVLAVSGVAAATITVAIYFLPGMRETEGRISLSPR